MLQAFDPLIKPIVSLWHQAVPLFPGVALALQTALVVYLVLGEPFWGKYKYAELSFKAPGDPGARSRFYRWILLLEWSLVGLVALSFWLERRPVLATLGLRAGVPFSRDMLIGLGGGILGFLAVMFLAVRYFRHLQEHHARRLEALGPMIPTTGWERFQFALVSLTAGFCEEVLFRGFLFFYIASLVPGVLDWALVAASGVIFGLAHLYQGWTGVFTTGLLGALFGWMFLGGNLWGPIILHAVIDLQTLVVAWAVQSAQRSRAA